MSIVLSNPLGLLALLSLPAIYWLHKYVLRGRPRQVSCLALWATPETIGIEGKTRQRTPLTWVLLLELVAATLLSLLLAGFDIKQSPKVKQRVAILVDGSASMAGGDGSSALEQAAERIKQLDNSLLLDLFISGNRPTRLGQRNLETKPAQQLLLQQIPVAPHHSLETASEVLAAAGYAPQQTLIFTDDPDYESPRAVHVGKPTNNFGLINARWPRGGKPFVVIRRFGDGPTKIKATLQLGDNKQSLPLDFFAGETARQELPLELNIPEEMQRFSLTLPRDGLAADNRVVLLRPHDRGLRVKINHPDRTIAGAVDRVVQAVASAEMTVVTSGADLLVGDGRVLAKGSYNLVFDRIDSGHLLSTSPLTVDPFAPLARGLDSRGLVWFGAPTGDRRHAMLRAGKHPLIWSEKNRVVVQLDPIRSNFFEHSAFPVFMDNLAQQLLSLRGDLVRLNWRAGEDFSVRRPANCRNETTVMSPNGTQHTFAADEPRLDLGPLSELGLYQIECGTWRQQFAVNLLDAVEGDLAARRQPSPTPALGSFSSRGAARTGTQQVLLLAVCLCLLSAWLLLKRRRGSAT